MEKITETIDTTKDIIKESQDSGFKDFEDAIQHYCATSNKKLTQLLQEIRQILRIVTFRL